MQKTLNNPAYACLDNYFNDATDYSTLNTLGKNFDGIDFDKLTDDYIKTYCNVHYTKSNNKQADNRS